MAGLNQVTQLYGSPAILSQNRTSILRLSFTLQCFPAAVLEKYQDCEKACTHGSNVSIFALKSAEIFGFEPALNSRLEKGQIS
ncbi:hypothetical protein PoB_003881800 [Plakobranchus ocellatus]|uniref:Uncharacterized protein n=1 Tax=Plakobranchus ocellatus TaxID=259542 RepID=A0AAV4B0Q7_9GAST|nr:hypothetical protein PoB_003881800 [Plakobranchus ocellatus]